MIWLVMERCQNYENIFSLILMSTLPHRLKIFFHDFPRHIMDQDIGVWSDDSSDDEAVSYLIATGMLPGLEQDERSKRRGASQGKRPNINRGFDKALRRLQEDYFSSKPKYGEASFERRFRMPRVVFNRLYTSLEGKSIFVRRRDALNKNGIHPLQRVVAAVRMLGYGVAADALDEYLQMSEDSVLLSVKGFCREVVRTFGQEYMREPNEADLMRIMGINAARGFPGCIGSIDCQHWEWKNCPIAWAGQFKGKEKKPTVVLEAICDGELWIWHAHFGCPGSLNDINVLDTSKTLRKIIAGVFPP